jgi:hypothetical protein
MHGELWHIAASYSIKKGFGIFLDLTAVSLLRSAICYRHTGEYPEGHESRYPEYIEITGLWIYYASE